MALRTIMGMMTGFIIIGIVAAALIILCYVLYFQLIHRRILHREGRMHIGRLCIGILTAGYVGMVFAVTCLRGSGYNEMHMSTHIFQSYREAWNSGSASEWRNIIWNILMFVPIGFLLPLNGKILRKWWVTPAICLAATIGIESVQLFAGQGIFELDDIFNNFVGGLIGCGLIQLFFPPREKRHRVWRIALCLMPAFAVLLGAGILYGCYESQPYGNLQCNYAYRIAMKDVALKWDVTAIEANPLTDGESAPVYQATIGTNEDAVEWAKSLYENMGLELDEANVLYYDDSVYCDSSTDSYTIAIEKKGMYYSYTDFSKFNDEGGIMEMVPGADEQTVREAMEKLHMELPENAQFEEDTDSPGRYNFTVTMQREGDDILDGTCSCELYADGTIKDVSNHIIKYQSVAAGKLISLEEVRRRIEEGRFRYWDDDFTSLEIEAARIEYQMDSKGFYRPVYVLETMVDGKAGDAIAIPAGAK